jgi:hypothetical protein
LSVDGDISEDLLGKLVTDLQRDITIEDGQIRGTLLYVDGYSGFSEDPEFQSGHFLALHFDGGDEEAGIAVELVGGDSSTDVRCAYRLEVEDEHSEAILDSEGESIETDRLGSTIMIFRVTDKDSQAVRAVAKKTGLDPDVVLLSLAGLALEDAP